MESSAEHVELVHYQLPPLRERRMIPWAVASIFALVLVAADAYIGPTLLERSFLLHPIKIAALQAAALIPIVFLFWIVYSRRSRATLELAPHKIRLVPSGIDQSLLGIPPEELAIPNTPQELLLCQTIIPDKPETYRIVARTSDGSERGIGGRDTYTRISLRAADVAPLVEALRSATDLPVRSVIRRQSQDGTVEETPWQPLPPRGRGLIALMIATGILPFAGGSAMGLLAPNPVVVVLGGLGLWLALWVVAIAALARRGPSGKKTSYLRFLTTIVPFSATYAVCYVVTNSMRHGH